MDITTIQPPTAATAPQLDLSVQNNVVQQQLTRLPVGVTLIGSVVGNDRNGNLIIRLAGNDLILSSPLALSKNAQVALQIQNVSGSFTATLLSVDGKLPATQPQTISNQLQQNPNALLKDFIDNSANAKIIAVLNQGAAKVAPQATTVQNTLVAKSDIVTLTSPQTTIFKGLVITATPEIVQNLKTALAANDAKAANSELLDSLPEEITPGNQLNLKITAVQNPPKNIQGENYSIQTDNNILAKPEVLQADKLVDAISKITQPQLPTDAKQVANNLQQLVQNFAAGFKPLPSGNIFLNAIVIDTKPGGELLVETRFGKVIINAGEQFTHVEKGSVLNLELTSIAATPQDALKLPGDELPLQQLAKTWPALKALSDYLAPATDPTAVHNKLAGVENMFAARLAAFMNAVKSGNLRDWIGTNNYDAMEADSTGSVILGKVKHDMDVIHNLMLERSGNWQTMLFPVYDGHQLHQARLHVKYLPDQNNQPDKKAGTRFIVELNTSYFGEIQMDGLVHNNAASKYFDMIIRTHNALDAQTETDIRQIFTDAGQVTGFKGDIEFTTIKEFPVKIFDSIVEGVLSAKIDHKGIEA